VKIITTHKNTDFDGVASVFAASLLHPEAQPVLPRSLNPNVQAFLSIHKDHFSFKHPKDIALDDIGELVVVDANSWSRLDDLSSLAEKTSLIIHLWDHHMEPGDIEADWSCSRPVGATTTLIVGQLQEEKPGLSPIQATLFLAGIYEDTGNLTFPGTVPEDASAVAFLLGQQADLNIIRSFLRPVYGPKQKDILFEMLKNPTRVKVNGYKVSFSALDIQGHTPGLAVVVAMYQDIMNVDASFAVFRDPKTNRAMVIGRSSVDGLDIGAIMRSLGGGGHPNAGSAIVKGRHPDALHEQIMMFIKGHKQAAVQISDLMSFPVSYVPPTATMKQVALVLRQKGCTGLPVLDGDTLMGIISRRDFKKMRKPDQLELPVKAFMSDRIITVAPESSVVQAAKLMVKHDIGRLPVMKDGALIGIVTRSDAMRYYYDLLPPD